MIVVVLKEKEIHNLKLYTHVFKKINIISYCFQQTDFSTQEFTPNLICHFFRHFFMRALEFHTGNHTGLSYHNSRGKVISREVDFSFITLLCILKFTVYCRHIKIFKKFFFCILYSEYFKLDTNNYQIFLQFMLTFFLHTRKSVSVSDIVSPSSIRILFFFT